MHRLRARVPMRQVGCLDGAPLTRGTFSCRHSPTAEARDEETAEATAPTDDAAAEVVGSKRARVDDGCGQPPRASSKLAIGASRRIDVPRHPACGAPPGCVLQCSLPVCARLARPSAVPSYSFKAVCKASDKTLSGWELVVYAVLFYVANTGIGVAAEAARRAVSRAGARAGAAASTPYADAVKAAVFPVDRQARAAEGELAASCDATGGGATRTSSATASEPGSERAARNLRSGVHDRARRWFRWSHRCQL